jgi:hypothetical protein
MRSKEYSVNRITSCIEPDWSDFMAGFANTGTQEVRFFDAMLYSHASAEYAGAKAVRYNRLKTKSSCQIDALPCHARNEPHRLQAVPLGLSGQWITFTSFEVESHFVSVFETGSFTSTVRASQGIAGLTCARLAALSRAIGQFLGRCESALSRVRDLQNSISGVLRDNLCWEFGSRQHCQQEEEY